MGKIWDRLFKREQERVNMARTTSSANAMRGVSVGRGAIAFMRAPAFQAEARFRRPRMRGAVALQELADFRREVRRGRMSLAEMERWIDQNWTDEAVRTGHNIVVTEGVNALITCFFKN